MYHYVGDDNDYTDSDTNDIDDHSNSTPDVSIGNDNTGDRHLHDDSDNVI